ncbi:MAG: hypothetical protein H6766_06835 [Candidatus Peribacteria bacterium]|nr:MAG: hypothetical protein H6766_06835 [Candidatus Peribacteria bacterium]
MTYYTPRSELYPLQYGAKNPILRTITTEVNHHDPEVQKIAEALTHLIHDYDGV